MPSIPSLKYSPRAIGLHWLIGVLILGMLTVGFTMTDIPRGTPERAMVYNWHKTFGLIVGFLVLYRWWWRSKNPPPILPPSVPSWEVTMANISHRLLYACMFIMPVSGYLGSNFHPKGYGVKLFDVIELPAWGIPSEEIYAVFNGTHKVVALIFATLVALHILAALRHLVMRNGIFSRIWP